jgi:hypothetical protein
MLKACRGRHLNGLGHLRDGRRLGRPASDRGDQFEIARLTIARRRGDHVSAFLDSRLGDAQLRRRAAPSARAPARLRVDEGPDGQRAARVSRPCGGDGLAPSTPTISWPRGRDSGRCPIPRTSRSGCAVRRGGLRDSGWPVRAPVGDLRSGSTAFCPGPEQSCERDARTQRARRGPRASSRRPGRDAHGRMRPPMH